MLPLWIIDITEQPDRQGAFQHLVDQIGHVKKANKLYRNRQTDQTEASATSEKKVSEESKIIAAKQEETSYQTDSDDDKDANTKRTTKELIEERERRAAEKNALLEGNYWYYSTIDNYFDDVDYNDAETVAKRLYEFQSDLVEEGQRFIKEIRQSNVKPYQTINIIVLGDSTEKLTRIVFPSIAAILQKEKGRFLPHHIHQGMDIMGMLFVPCDINARKVDERNSIQRTLNEIHVQYKITSIRGYDHMLLYQDVQNRTECNYSLLDSEGQAEYLFQCLVHLFLACDKTHPLLSGTGSADDFYISLGAASVFFDMSAEDEKERITIANEIIKSFKEKGEFEKKSAESPLVLPDEYSPYTYFQDSYKLDEIDLDDIEPEVPNPHPVKGFLAKQLKRYYYNTCLRFFPADFYHRTVAKVEENTRKCLEEIAANSRKKFKDSENRLKSLIFKKLTTINVNDGGLPNIVHDLKDMQAKLSENRKEIRPYLNRDFWPRIEKYVHKTPLEDPFTDYHDTYLQDLKAKNEGSGCETMKNEAKNALRDLLSKESTILGAIGRCFMGGIIYVLAFFPLLALISPYYINLGDIEEYWFLWGPGIFAIPTIIFLIKRWWYLKKKSKLLKVLKAYYLHDAYARIANRIDSEINGFYDKMIALCNAYLTRCDLIKKEVLNQSNSDLVKKPEIPVTKFNQPLAGGSFGNIQLLPAEKHDDSVIKVNYIPKKVNDLKKSDYFLLINQFHKDFELLFDGLYLTMNFMLRQDPETGEETMVTKAQQEKEINETWEANKVKFREELHDSVKSVMEPRQNATVSEKLLAYMRNIGAADVPKPLIEFAACNGEITSTADNEYADVKANSAKVEEKFQPFLPIANTKFQIEKYDAFYKKYIFVTRWRSFNQFSFNRILPTEDFDKAIHEELVSDYVASSEENKQYQPSISSIALWALCPDDTSTEWFKLIDSEHFQEAFEMRNIYHKILNQND